MDCVLDGPLLHVPCTAAGSHPATNLLCYPAGSWYDHGEDIMLRSCITNEYVNGRLSQKKCFFRKIKISGGTQTFQDDQFEILISYV